MRSSIGSASLFALILGLAMTGVAVALPAYVSIYQAKGPSVFSLFRSTDSTGYVVTDVTVFASDAAAHEPGAGWKPSPVAIVVVSQFNTSTLEYLLHAYGQTPFLTYSSSRDLSHSALQTDVLAFDFASNHTITFSVNLTWTASGPVSRDAFNYRDTDPAISVNSHSQGSFRPAEATGTVAVGAINYTPNASHYAQIQDLQTGQVGVTVRPGAPTSAKAEDTRPEIATTARSWTWGRLKMSYR